AARQRGLDVEEIVKELAALDPTGLPPVAEETDALLDHILTRYHETHRRELLELIPLARKVEAVHEANPHAPRGLADTLQQLAGELEVHMKKEELILFPAMRRGASPMMAHPI